ncbi:Ig-like domain-containing protein [Flavivirga eckloniae]|uniref:BIG2 domain-containing protein n=1 Tax=Flavivirga eckloniae TaxID=1803846 RepID=A0A2K9PM02_9FLAO|nr:Ig-like domain-containing protein [Flavivirga eckloniae]AUP77597.1 hypothetical protein C1H87_02235 [Flavivirga eckloniae]
MKRKVLPILMLVLATAFTQIFAQRPFFNKNTDILIAQFDSKPDPDDIHAQAALGCMLAHPDLAGVEYYAVAGAVGIQNGQFIDSDNLFNMAFGSSNWTDADANWSASVTNIKNKVVPILQAGGKVWVQEAGQSNITADWIAQVLQTVSASTVKNNVIVVQHSNWNENQTASSDLNYVKDKAKYFAIDDGNAPFGAGWGDRGPWETPEYRSKQSTWIAQAKSSVNPVASQLWTEADNIIDTLWPNGYPHDWSYIHFDGVDYSDCAENWWIFNIGSNADSTAKFWSRYVTNTPSGTVNVTSITVSPSALSINVGDTGTLNETVSPSNATDKSVSWSSNNTAVATVNSSGMVTGISTGTATITVTTNDGGFTDTSTVTVSSLPPGTISIGNPTNTNAGIDGWKSNLVINESETYTNTSGASQTLNVNQFVFYANRKADPVTPFVVKVNANNDFTVLAVGTSRASSAYNVGENTVAFNTGTAKQITLANGETIAPGFLDANANGSGGSVGSVIPFDSNSPADEIWYSGGSASGNSASVSEGSAPTGGQSTITNLTRNYRFKINLSVNTGNPGVSVTGITVAPTSLNLTVGNSGNLTETVSPSNASNKSVSWSSSNTSVATVNSSGVVSAVAVGTSVITVTTADGGFTATSNVTVTAGGGGSTTVTLSPIHDAYLQGSTNFNNNIIRIESGNRVGYLMYDLSGVTGTITNVDLKMTCNSDSGNGNININLGTSNNWTETTLSNSNKPGLGTLLGNLNSTYSIGSTYTWALNANALSGGGNVSLVVSATSGNDAAFASKENSVTEPQLVITYNSSSASKAVKSAALSVIKSNRPEAKLLPNPISNGAFKINFYKHNGPTNITIFDVMGRLVYKTKTSENQLILDSNIFASKGFYFINVLSDNHRQTIKAVVE